jgi:hypothetical protein
MKDIVIDKGEERMYNETDPRTKDKVQSEYKAKSLCEGVVVRYG